MTVLADEPETSLARDSASAGSTSSTRNYRTAGKPGTPKLQLLRNLNDSYGAWTVTLPAVTARPSESESEAQAQARP